MPGAVPELSGRRGGGRGHAGRAGSGVRAHRLGPAPSRSGSTPRRLRRRRRQSRRRTARSEADAGRLGDRDLIVGVDRLDYSKGLEERFLAYDQFLTDNPSSREQVQLLQIAPTAARRWGPTRASAPAWIPDQRPDQRRVLRHRRLDAGAVREPRPRAATSSPASTARPGSAWSPRYATA